MNELNEFAAMLKEALAGAEPYRPDEGSRALEESVRKFETRLRTVRFMAVFSVAFATVVGAVGFVLIVRAEDDATWKELFPAVCMALFGWSVVGFAKLWYAHMLNHLAIMKELKAVQLRLLDLQPGGAGGGRAGKDA